MKKTILSCVAILGLCTAMPALADVDDAFMDWSYASGLDPKPRPVAEERQRRTSDLATTQASDSLEALDADIFATSEINQTTNTQEDFNSSEYANWSYTSAQNSAQGTNSLGTNSEQAIAFQSWENGGNNAMNTMGVYTQNAQTGQVSANTQYYQVPIQAIQTPAEIHRISNPVKVQYPVTKQYPISMQYPVTIQKEITVQRPVVVQQPIVVQRPIVMQQPVMVQHQPLMLQNKPLMVQQQPTVVQKQPIIVSAPAPTVTPAPVMQVSGVAQSARPVSCPMTNHVSPMPQQMTQMGHSVTTTTPVIQIPVQVNGTLTGTFMPSTGCNGGCVK